MMTIAFFVACSHFISMPTTAADRSLILATTTSVRDSGLLEALLPTFEEQSGIEVRVIAVGTGAASATATRRTRSSAPGAVLRVGAASGARQTATGGAIKAKAAADYATSLHDAEQWDTTEATAASAASWEACKDVDP